MYRCMPGYGGAQVWGPALRRGTSGLFRGNPEWPELPPNKPDFSQDRGGESLDLTACARRSDNRRAGERKHFVMIGVPTGGPCRNGADVILITGVVLNGDTG